MLRKKTARQAFEMLPHGSKTSINGLADDKVGSVLRSGTARACPR